MSNAKMYDVVGMGNAVVDIVANVDDELIQKYELKKGAMNLVNHNLAEKIHSELKDTLQFSGGSVANTMSGMAAMGGKVAFIGKVKSDVYGEIFHSDMYTSGVTFNQEMPEAGLATSRSIILVTPDAERTMATYLGVSREIGTDDVDMRLIKKAKMLYLEGYLWDLTSAQKAIVDAIKTAKSVGAKIAFSLSDSFCVERHRKQFLSLIKTHVDIVFANEYELKNLFVTDDIDHAFAECKKLDKIFSVTMGAKGCSVIQGEAVVNWPAEDVVVVDKTGAGDLFAAGFLYGFNQDFDMQKCAKIGSATAGEVIKAFGARPGTKLQKIIHFNAK